MPQTRTLKDLLNDHQSGSSELVKKTIDWLQAGLQKDENNDKFLKKLEALCRAHPSMALLQSLSGFFHKIPLNAHRVQAWLEMYQKHEAAACRHFAQYLANFKNVLIYSNSGLLLAALRSTTPPLNIFCTEGRPSYEGKLLAEALTDSTKHRIFLTTDIAAFSLLPRVEIVAFGCDAITPRGIVNKIGTHALSQMASLNRKMVYVVGTSEKVVDHWNDEFLLRQGPREQIHESESSIQVENYYFDLTPYDLIRGIFLETGLTNQVNYEKTAAC